MFVMFLIDSFLTLETVFCLHSFLISSTTPSKYLLYISEKNFHQLECFSFQKMSDDQLTRLFGAVERNSHLETLSMANTGLSDRHLDALTAALAENNTLRTLKWVLNYAFVNMCRWISFHTLINVNYSTKLIFVYPAALAYIFYYGLVIK